MPLPCPIDGTRRLVLGVVLALLVSSPGHGIDIRTGNLILTDRVSDPFGFGDERGTLLLIDPQAPQLPVQLVASPGGFQDPVATIPLSDGRILCLDENAEVMGDASNRGAVWVVDPALTLPGRADPFAWSSEWVNPIDILQEPTGDLLVLDKDADPLGVGTKPGALYRVDFETQEVTPVASSGLWVEPKSIAFDLDGSILVWDSQADPNNLGTFPGALFRVDPISGSVEVIFSVDAFDTPVVIGIDPNGDYLLLDRNANPEGHPGNPGGLFRISPPPTLTIEPLLFFPEFVAPVDFLLDPGGDIWILDQRANPIHFPRPTGALFRCDPEAGVIVKTLASGFFQELTSMSRFEGSALDSSLVTWEDLDGPPLEPGDRMQIRVLARNTGAVAGRPVELEHQISSIWDYHVGSDSVSEGTYLYDTATQTVHWSGDIESQGEVSIHYEIRLDDNITEGSVVRQEIVLQVGRTGSSFVLEGVVARRSGPGRFVWADYVTSAGANHGVILEMPEGATVPSVVYEGAPLVQPDDLALLPDGRIAVLDRRSRPLGEDQPPGGIFRIDPLNGAIDTLLALGNVEDLRFPVGLAVGEIGELLLVDKDADPYGYPGLPGAVYSVEIESGSLRLISSVPEFSEPADAILETTGSILLVDYDADPLGSNPHGGAVFVIDRTTGAAEPIEVPAGKFVDPIGIAEGRNGTVYVADLGADPEGIGGNTGAVFEIHRRFGDTVLLASADSVFVDPTDVFPTDDGWLIVTDRDANPFGLPPRDRGAVFRVRPRVGGPSIVAADPSMYGPEAVAGVVIGDVGPSDLDVVDLNGPPTLGGDTLRFEASIFNAGRASIPEVMATFELLDDLTLVGADGPGEISVEEEEGIVSWLGSVTLTDTVRVTLEAEVGQDLRFGDRVSALMNLAGPGAPPVDSAAVRVAAPLTPGDIVLVDANADPDNHGATDGALFLLRMGEGNTPLLLQTDTLWYNPSAIERLDTNRFLIADPRGVESGSILVADYLNQTTEPYIVDDRLGAPSDLHWTRGGDLLIVDPSSRVEATELRTPAVFVQRGGEGDLEVLAADSVFTSPSQIAEDDAGRVWLIDRRADPNGTETGRGALFEIDPQEGTLLDTLQFPDLLSPTGIVNWTDAGLLITDELSAVGGTHNGAIFLFDPETRSLRTQLTDARFRQPRTATFTPSGELWITDRLARDESLPGSPRTLFEWNPETDQVVLVGASSNYASPMEVIALPGPNPRLASYEIEDPNGSPLEAGDDLSIRVQVANIGSIPTHSAVYRDTLPPQVRLDETSVRADQGIIEFLSPGNGLVWRLDLPPGSSYELQYGAQVFPGTAQGSNLRFRSHLRTEEGVHRVRSSESRIPVYFEDNHIYLVDDDADPLGIGGRSGGIWKVYMPNGAATGMAGGEELVSPVDLLKMPTIETSILIIDADANPGGFARGKGSVWKWIPDTGGVGLVAADSSFRSPRAAAAINDHEILLLDAQADPWDLKIGLGPGAVFRINVATGEVEPFASDTLLYSPTDLILDGAGGAYLVDPEADPGHFGLRNGAVFRLDLAERDISVFAASADFRGPIAATLDENGDLLVLDRDVQLDTHSDARGAVYRVDARGNVSFEVASTSFRRPHDINFDPFGRLLVSDRDADPRGRGAPTGAIFRRQFNETQLRVLSAAQEYVDPSGFFSVGFPVAVELSGLEASVSDEGIRIEWVARGSGFNGFLCLRADGADAGLDEYEILNADAPIGSTGPWAYLDSDVMPGETYSYQIAALLPDGGERTYGPIVATASGVRPFALLPISPNPVLNRTGLRFDLPAAGAVRLRIYDLAGRQVCSLIEETLPGGRYLREWDGRNGRGHPVASGLYLVRLTWQNRSATGRLVLLH